MFRTLYARLAVGLVLLFFSVAIFYALASSSLIDHHLQRANQQLHRNLAHDLVMDRNLVRQGQLNEKALKQTFHDYMVINPSIEIYLLDLDGTLLAYSAEPNKVKRKHVSLAPIHAFLQQQQFPLLGDDPRSHDRQKAFSVTPIPSAAQAEGYLYVVLQGEEYDAVNNAVRDGEITRLALTAVLVSLVLGGLVGLILFYGLTRRLRALAQSMDKFRDSNYSYLDEETNLQPQSADEIGVLRQTFNQMAKRIVEQINALQDKDQLRRELVAQVSHDLRTPLTSLHGYLETLAIKQGKLSAEQQQHYIKIALRHSKRLGKLVDSLFELAKLDARETLANQESFVMAELMHDILQKYQLYAEQKQLDLTAECSDDYAFVWADIGLIERVLENLIENAISNTRPGDKITLTCAREGDGIVISVLDSGIGIATEDLPHIFERFYQGSHSNKQHGGAGLGLAIVKQILALHGSEMEVSSGQQGTRFSFRLPVYQPYDPPKHGDF